MKNNNLKFQKITAFILLISFFTQFAFIKKANATVAGDATLTSILGKDISKMIIDKKFDLGLTIKAGMNLYQNTITAKNVVQNIKNFDLESFAKNASGEVLNEVGDTIIKDLGIKKGPSTNIFTNGKDIITNLEDYLDYTEINEIKKGLGELEGTQNTSNYSVDAMKLATNFLRNKSEEKTGKILEETLSYIAKNEICSSKELKDIIKNGEPETMIKPKPPVKNVDIDELCDTSLFDQTDEKEYWKSENATKTTLVKSGKKGELARASFIGLAKAHYGGKETEKALADPANTKSGVAMSAFSSIINRTKEKLSKKEEQTKANGMVIGKEKCLDKDGNEIKFDPTNPDKYCDSQNTSVEGSGAVTKENIAAGKQSRIQALVVKANAINNKLSNGQSTLTNALSVASSIINLGTTDMNEAMSEGDNPYKQLANSLSSLRNSTMAQDDLYKKSASSSRDYLLGTKLWTIDDLKNRIDIYERLREFNIKKLNDHTYTYLILKYATKYGPSAVLQASQNARDQELRSTALLFGLGGPVGLTVGWISGQNKKTKTSIADEKNKANAGYKIAIAIQNEILETRKLIKEMAYNNYREQQMKKLLDELTNTENVDLDNNQEALSKALNGTVDDQSLEILMEDWLYSPSYVEADDDPSVMDYDKDGKPIEDTKRYIPTKDEMSGQYTEENLRYLRIRAYKMLRDGIKPFIDTTGQAKQQITGTSSTMIKLKFTENEIKILNGYGAKDITELTPNVSRLARAKYVFKTTDKKIAEYSEITLCKEIGVDICNMSELAPTITEEELDNINKAINDVDNMCNSGESGILDEIKRYCATNKNQSSECVDENAMNMTKNNIMNWCKDGASVAQ